MGKGVRSLSANIGISITACWNGACRLQKDFLVGLYSPPLGTVDRYCVRCSVFMVLVQAGNRTSAHSPLSNALLPRRITRAHRLVDGEKWFGR